ncbi:MAG: urea carboxylase-associated family protein [Chloroflexi bacterium]|nr:urea carboxylase-associated family protein [Chloroflexota bacterium]
MSWKVIQDRVVPRCSGTTAKVDKGQILRIIEHEGKQVLDLTFLNAHNHKESFATELSAILNSMQGTGGYYRLKTLYSKPPFENVMATVVDDKVGDGARGGVRAGHFMAGHCSRQLVALRGIPGARSCSDNLKDAFAEIGLRQEDCYDPSIFNVWMQSWIDDNGGMNWARPLAEVGDYIDFRADMDLVAVLSICPTEFNACNDFKAKALRFQVIETEGAK